MKHVYTALACLLLPALGSAAESIELATPHTGTTKISGKIVNGTGKVVRLTRTHADGHSEQQTTVVDAKGNFRADVAPNDKLMSGDKVTAEQLAPASTNTDSPVTKNATTLPVVTQVVTTAPPIIKFASSLSQTNGSTISVTITSDAAWPKALGDMKLTVIADDALQYASGVTASGTLPDASSLKVSLIPVDDAGTTTVSVEDPLCEWGRVRCYAYFGAIFSQTNGDFSKTDPYLDFSVEWNWFKWKNSRSFLTTFFDTRLTTIPTPASAGSTAAGSGTSASGTGTSATGAAGTGTSTSGNGTAAPSASDAFASSSKSPQVLGGAYYAPWSTKWAFKDTAYGLFAAGLYKGGVQRKLDGVVDNSQLAFPNQGKSVYSFNAGGVRVGFVKWHADVGEAHELLSYLDFTVGKYRLYDFVGPNFQREPGGGVSNVRHYGMRKVFEGRIKIPSVNLRLGVDANLGQGQNDLRFLVTTNAIDIFRSLVGQK